MDLNPMSSFNRSEPLHLVCVIGKQQMAPDNHS
uniref:Uncharacterized protein n=1 Tax=Tetranychus urticae TaxID=32264 RepID=T1K8H1_TETUR